MFFKQIRRSAARNRKGNGLYFASLVIAIVAFYTLLSLGSQDVMRFLKTIESDAVGKLLRLLPVVYGVSLFFVFFMVYFACRYQISRRRKEFGIYLMMGMKRSRLLSILFGETLINSIISLVIGLPVALFLTEGISLITAKIAGLGIIGHTFTFSGSAIFWTIAGFVLVQFVSMAILSVRIVTAETGTLIQADNTDRQTVSSKKTNSFFFIMGCMLLATGYYLAVFRLRSLSFRMTLITAILWILGTFLMYRGWGGFLGKSIRKRSPAKTGLWTFTARQVQENVLSQYKSLAVASLLLTGAMACVSYGIAVGTERSSDARSVDVSLYGTQEDIEDVLSENEIANMTKNSYPLYLSSVKEQYDEGKSDEFDLSQLKEALRSLHDSNGTGENIADNMHIRYLVNVSSYNQILSGLGKEKISLSDGDVAVFTSLAGEGEYGRILNQAIQKGVSIGIDGKAYQVKPTLYIDNVVADRSITLSAALIVPDDLYSNLTDSNDPYCTNVQIKDTIIKRQGLMQAEQKMSELLSRTGIEYDSYLGGVGRTLFYKVASSYLTIYLGVLLWLIANTVIGLKIMISQRENIHRYEILSMIGADSQTEIKSAKRQISVYFLLVAIPALISSIFAVWAMLANFLQIPYGTSVAEIAGLSAAAIAVFAGLEILYIEVVKRSAGREIRQMEER
ncbi:MAG: ABC transporter permease [Erysipelotrichaceae bacterium]|nr:ABC transporter permease [Erysipelotrichaceae bacterium]